MSELTPKLALYSIESTYILKTNSRTIREDATEQAEQGGHALLTWFDGSRRCAVYRIHYTSEKYSDVERTRVYRLLDTELRPDKLIVHWSHNPITHALTKLCHEHILKCGYEFVGLEAGECFYSKQFTAVNISPTEDDLLWAFMNQTGC